MNVLAEHRQHTFLPVDAKAVGSSEYSLLVHMKHFPTSTFKLILRSQSTSFIQSTNNAACTFLLALRTVYPNATTTLEWPKDLSTQGSCSWHGHPSSKCTSRSLDFKCRDSSGSASSSR